MPGADLTERYATVLREAFAPLIARERPVALVDFPDSPNCGHHATWLGEKRFLSDLGDLVEAAGRVSKAAFVRTVRRELSCALCKGNARMYYNSLSRIALHVGHNFRPGCDEPVEGPDEV